MSFMRVCVLCLAVIAGVAAAQADTFQLILSGNGVSGVLNLTATSEGLGVYFVIGATGHELDAGKKLQITGLIQLDSIHLSTPMWNRSDQLCPRLSRKLRTSFNLMRFHASHQLVSQL
jgi:hypothetical protein